MRRLFYFTGKMLRFDPAVTQAFPIKQYYTKAGVSAASRCFWRNTMTTYIYPQNLRAKANLWLWSLRDFLIMGIAALLSVVILVQTHIFLPAAATFDYGHRRPALGSDFGADAHLSARSGDLALRLSQYQARRYHYHRLSEICRQILYYDPAAL